MSLAIRSLLRSTGRIEISLEAVEVPTPAEHEVVVRIDAAPLNPSDLRLLLAGADLSTALATGTAERPVVSAAVSPGVVAAMKARLDQAIPVGTEGAGEVVAAGAAPAAQALLGKLVGIAAGGTYAQHRAVPANQCLVLPEGVTAADGASSFVNPMTALAMLETLKKGGHRALVHTAAASNLGQMLIKLCARDGVALVNVVRRPEHVALLRERGAAHVCDSSAASFTGDLRRAIAETGATVAFDATGGGPLADQILAAMEAALVAGAGTYNPYGSTTHKQVYLYGGLDRRPTELTRAYGMSWGVGGWLVRNELATLPLADVLRLRQRVAAELTSTFASHYTKEISLAELLDVETMRGYARQATGEKVLVRPNQT